MRKKFLLILALMLMSSVAFIGCSREDEVYIITDRFFSRQVTDILENPRDFNGRTVQINGMFMSDICDITGDVFYFVGRVQDDCCGGGIVGPPIGFEIYLGNNFPAAENAWVQIIGVLEQYNVPGIDQPILRINVRTMIRL